MLSYIKWSEQLRIKISLIWCKSRHYLAFHIRRAVLMNYQKFQFGNTACSLILDKSSILYYERSDLSPESKSQCTSCSLTLTTSRGMSGNLWRRPWREGLRETLPLKPHFLLSLTRETFWFCKMLSARVSGVSCSKIKFNTMYVLFIYFCW